MNFQVFNLSLLKILFAYRTIIFFQATMWLNMNNPLAVP